MSVSLTAFPVLSVVDVVPKIVEVIGNDTSQVRVINKSDHVEYVTVTLSRLLNPGVPYEKEKLEPIGMIRNLRLYAYPFKISLARGQSKVIKLKPLSTVERETVYRLDVKPVVAISGEGLANLGAGVAVNLSFRTLVRQLPEHQISTIHADCRANSIILTATGNVRYSVKKMRIDNVLHDDFNIYPGTPIFLSGGKVTLDGEPICNQ